MVEKPCIRTIRSAACASFGLVRAAGRRCASLTARCFSAEIVAAVRTFVDLRSEGADAGSAGSLNLTFLAAAGANHSFVWQRTACACPGYASKLSHRAVPAELLEQHYRLHGVSAC